MKKCSKLLAMVLAALMLLSSVTACGEGDSSNTKETTGGVVTDAPETEGETNLAQARAGLTSNLPEANFDGREFRFYNRDWGIKFLYAEEQDGEVVNDAIFAANSAVEEKYGVDIVAVDSGMGDVDHIAAVKRIITSNDDAFEIAFGHDMLTPQASLEGYFLNIYDIPHLDLTQPWWSQPGLKEFTVNDVCYLGLGSISYMSLDQARIIYINEDLAEEYQITLPYEDVLAGTWTLDKLVGMTKDFYEDLNGNSQVDEEDLYGFSTEGGCYGYIENFGINVIGKDEDELLTVGFEMEKMIDVIGRVYQWLCESKGAHMTDDANKYEIELFTGGRLLMGHFSLGGFLKDVRETNISYGLVPMPKYDEAQENYVTSTVEHPFIFPSDSTEDKLDFAGFIVEAMSLEGYKKIFPAYYEIALQNKYFDNQSVEMIKIINETATMSFSFVYGPLEISLPIHSMMCGKSNPSGDFASHYARNEKAFIKKINDIVKAFE